MSVSVGVTCGIATQLLLDGHKSFTTGKMTTEQKASFPDVRFSEAPIKVIEPINSQGLDMQRIETTGRGH